MTSRYLALWTIVLASTTACSGGSNGGNFLGGNDYPSGDIILSHPESGAQFSTSETHPLVVDGNTFSIGIYEQHFGGPYTVTPVSNDSGFKEPCYEPHTIDTTDAVNVVQFRPDNAAPGGTVAANPCNPAQNDEEVWMIGDGKGNDRLFYYELPANPVTASARIRS